IGLPWLGVKGLIVAGAAVDLALGVLLLAPRRPLAVGAAVASVAALGLALFAVRLEPHYMASGVYRDGALMDPSRSAVLTHLDCKTSTVSVTRRNSYLTLHSNGKPEGSIREDAGPPSPDEIT